MQDSFARGRKVLLLFSPTPGGGCCRGPEPYLPGPTPHPPARLEDGAHGADGELRPLSSQRSVYKK